MLDLENYKRYESESFRKDRPESEVVPVAPFLRALMARKLGTNFVPFFCLQYFSELAQ